MSRNQRDGVSRPATNDEVGVAVVQTPAQPVDQHAALAALERTVARLADDGVDLIVVPEFAITGYDLRLDYAELAQSMAEPTIDRLCALAQRHVVTLVTALPRIDSDGQLRDASLVATADGRAHVGAKRYLWGDERDIFVPAPRSGLLVSTAAATVGVVICYEAGFPETARELARAGADVIAVPAAFGRARLHVWQLLTRARAVENGCIVAAAGLCGANTAGVPFAGHSTIVDPYGMRIAELRDAPGVAVARVPHTAIARARTELPYLADLGRLEQDLHSSGRRAP
ncbi:nitrilase-related carbon-nitrogen hydrolase [Nocardia sp. R7R-8]|uniref:nitrilase-related carbon-nitrogen hydrolase n=1 Tax=Nocardia sp. R7R-8 TaxID=3459304 RepID=UPI00403D5A8E